MKAIGYILWYALLLFFAVLLGMQGKAIFGFVSHHLLLYKWLLTGFGGMVVFFSIFGARLTFFRVLIHEFTHTIVSWIFLRRVTSLQADATGNGVMYHQGGLFGGVFIDLAPYCLPILTYLVMLFRLIGADHSLWIFDLLIGITFGFHVCCWRKETGSHQTDINKRPLSLSYLFILCFAVFNLYVVLLSVNGGITHSFQYLYQHLTADAQHLYHMVAK